MVSVTHTTVVTGTHNPNKQVSKDQWNEGHTITGTPNTIFGFDSNGDPTDLTQGAGGILDQDTADTLYAAIDHNHDGVYQPLDSDLTAIAALSTQAYGRSLLEAATEAAFKALVNLEIGTDVQAYDATLMPAEWTVNFSADGDAYIAAAEAMTISQGNAKIGTGTITFEKSTNAAPGTFSSTTLPATLEAGAWLHVNAASVDGFVATHLVRTA